MCVFNYRFFQMFKLWEYNKFNRIWTGSEFHFALAVHLSRRAGKAGHRNAIAKSHG